jgi:hypothetical protein
LKTGSNSVAVIGAMFAIAPALLFLLISGSTEARTYPAGNGTRCAIGSDLDADGDIDVVVSNTYDGTVSLFFNDGTGALVHDCDLTVGTFPMGLASLDVDGDSDLDILCANYLSGTVTVLPNDGTGSFLPSFDLTVGAGPVDVLGADLDSDGDMDIACANYDGGTISLLINDGSGSFSSSSIAVGSGPGSIAVLDVDGSGAHLAVVLTSEGKVKIVGVDGTIESVLDAPGHPKTVSVCDLEDDGDNDLAVTGYDLNTLFVFMNDGSVFTRSDILLSGNAPHGLSAMDIDGNGLVDLAVTLSTSYQVQVVSQDSVGIFVPELPLATGTLPLSVLAADISGDGYGDLLVANFDSNSMSLLENGVDFSLIHVPEIIISTVVVELVTVIASYDH